MGTISFRCCRRKNDGDQTLLQGNLEGRQRPIVCRLRSFHSSAEYPPSGPLTITPQIFCDVHVFYEGWNEHRFRSDLMVACIPNAEAEAIKFRQDNHSRSSRGVLRGIHFQQPPEPQGMPVCCTVCCTVGAIFDGTVNLRRGSASYGH